MTIVTSSEFSTSPIPSIAIIGIVEDWERNSAIIGTIQSSNNSAVDDSFSLLFASTVDYNMISLVFSRPLNIQSVQQSDFIVNSIQVESLIVNDNVITFRYYDYYYPYDPIPSLSIVGNISDHNGNTIQLGDVIVSDGVVPEVDEIYTINTTAIGIEYSEILDPSTVQISDFSLRSNENITIKSVIVTGRNITIHTTLFSTDAEPTVILEGDIQDENGNSAQLFADSAEDMVAPAVSLIEVINSTTLKIVFSENIREYTVDKSDFFIINNSIVRIFTNNTNVTIVTSSEFSTSPIPSIVIIGNIQDLERNNARYGTIGNSTYTIINSTNMTNVTNTTDHEYSEFVNVSIPSGSSIPGCETDDTCFIPAHVNISLGGTVTWTNDDTAVHTVTSGSPSNGVDGEFDSSLIYPGAEFSYTATSVKTYDYFCIVHPWQTGTITAKSSVLENNFTNNSAGTVGTVTWRLPNHTVTEDAILQIVEPDLNTYSNFRIDIWSDSDGQNYRNWH